MKKKLFILLLSVGLLTGCSAKQVPPTDSTSGSVVQEQYVQVSLYLPNEQADGLIERSVQVEQSDQMVETLVQTLEVEGALPVGSDVRKWSLSNGDTTLKVDLNDEFAAGIDQKGTAGETAILASLVNTLWAYYEPDELILTVDGQPLETGHNIYDAPFTAPLTLSE